jgi:hypothetical protein
MSRSVRIPVLPVRTSVCNTCKYECVQRRPSPPALPAVHGSSEPGRQTVYSNMGQEHVGWLEE